MKKSFIYLILILFLLGAYFLLFYDNLADIKLFEFIYYANSLPIFLISTILASLFVKEKWYFAGINLDKYALRDFCIGSVLGIISVSIIALLAYLLGANLYCYILSSKFFYNLLSIFNNVGVEELIFRGLIFQVLYSNWSKIGSVIISAFLFTLAHIFAGTENFIIFFNTFIAGILFCLMYIKTKSLWLPFAFHSFWNIGIFLVFENTAEKTNYSSALFNLVQLQTNNNLYNVLIGKEYGFESGLFCTLILIIVMFIVTKLKPSYKINAEMYKQEFN